MRIIHEGLNEEVKIKKKYQRGVCVCYLISQPKVINVHGKYVYQTIVTNMGRLVVCGDNNLELFADAC